MPRKEKEIQEESNLFLICIPLYHNATSFCYSSSCSSSKKKWALIYEWFYIPRYPSATLHVDSTFKYQAITHVQFCFFSHIFSQIDKLDLTEKSRCCCQIGFVMNACKLMKKNLKAWTESTKVIDLLLWQEKCRCLSNH